MTRIAKDMKWYDEQYGDPKSDYSGCYAHGIPRFAQEENGFGIDYAIALLNLQPGRDRILDLGSGYGYAMDAWERRGFTVTGMEWSQQAILMSGKDNIVYGDIRDLSRFTDGEFAVVFSQATLEHLTASDIGKVVKQIHRIARYGVHYIAHETDTNDPSHVTCVASGEFADWLTVWMQELGGAMMSFGNPVQPIYPLFITAKVLPLRLRHAIRLREYYQQKETTREVA